MRNIWAVTRQTFIQCARTRIIVVFCLLLAICILGTGFKMTGDGTLKGRIQTFLSYSTSLTQLLLCLVTIFLTTSIITSDIRHKYIFTVASKPLARWQYVLGRWCGVVGLMGLLLIIALGSIYLLSQHLRKQPTRIEREAESGLTQPKKPDLDRLGVENEIFTARDTHLPEPPDIEKVLRKKIKQLIEERGKDNLIRDHINKTVPDKAQAEKMLSHPDTRQQAFDQIESALREQIIEDAHLVRPGKAIVLTFTGLKPASADESLLQIRYKLNPFKSGKTTLAGAWQVVNPDGPTDPPMSRSESAKTTSSFMIAPRFVSEEGRLTVFYFNLQPETIVKIQPRDVVVLQRVGGFESNFARAGLLILIRLMFLAAVSVLFGVFLSFPITSLAVMMIFTVGTISAFLHDATRLPRQGEPSAFEYFSHYLVKGIFIAVPTFSRTSASDLLVDGEYIAPKTLIREYLVTFQQPGTDSGRFWKTINLEIQTGMGLRTLLALAVGWLIFRRRELAGIS